MNALRLTPDEVRRARRRGLFTVTSETERGYYVTLLVMRKGREPVRLAQTKECVHPRTARRHAVALVRDALAPPRTPGDPWGFKARDPRRVGFRVLADHSEAGAVAVRTRRASKAGAS